MKVKKIGVVYEGVNNIRNYGFSLSNDNKLILATLGGAIAGYLFCLLVSDTMRTIQKGKKALR